MHREPNSRTSADINKLMEAVASRATKQSGSRLRRSPHMTHPSAWWCPRWRRSRGGPPDSRYKAVHWLEPTHVRRTLAANLLARVSTSACEADRQAGNADNARAALGSATPDEPRPSWPPAAPALSTVSHEQIRHGIDILAVLCVAASRSRPIAPSVPNRRTLIGLITAAVATFSWWRWHCRQPVIRDGEQRADAVSRYRARRR
jgi:hypothetical protein